MHAVHSSSYGRTIQYDRHSASCFAKGRDCSTNRRVDISRHPLVLSSFHVFVTVNNCHSNRSKASVRLLCILILLLAPCNWPGQNVRYMHIVDILATVLALYNPFQFFSFTVINDETFYPLECRTLICP